MLTANQLIQAICLHRESKLIPVSGGIGKKKPFLLKNYEMIGIRTMKVEPSPTILCTVISPLC